MAKVLGRQQAAAWPWSDSYAPWTIQSREFSRLVNTKGSLSSQGLLPPIDNPGSPTDCRQILYHEPSEVKNTLSGQPSALLQMTSSSRTNWGLWAMVQILHN